MKVIIAGGGIGGLVTALTLHKKGIEVKVFESVTKIKPLGVGINLLPHAMRVLTDLGLEHKLLEIAVETRELVYANKHGQLFWDEARGKFAGYKWCQLSIHRGLLQLLLFEEAIRRLGKGNVLTNHHLSHFEQDDVGVTVTLVDEKTGKVQRVEKGDVLLACDGIHSQVRKTLYPTEGEVKYSGNVLYRGTAIMKPYLTGASMVMIGHNQQKMVVYPIQKPKEDGTQLINWVANLKEGGDALKTRDWNREANKQRLLDKYADWRFNWLNVKDMISCSEHIYEFPMSDRDPLPKWTFGRVTLLGDAAHPMYPIGSNGASQAILDAAAIAKSLKSQLSASEALLHYEDKRLEATAKVVLQNRKKGPDFIMDIMEERFPNGFKQNEIPQDDLKRVMDNYRKVAGFDKQALSKPII